jgi:transcriptional regulator with XRE-family HTH domain
MGAHIFGVGQFLRGLLYSLPIEPKGLNMQFIGMPGFLTNRRLSEDDYRYMDPLARFLRYARSYLNWTQKDAGNFFEVSQSQFYGMESGRAVIDARKLGELCILMNVPFDAPFLGYIKRPPNQVNGLVIDDGGFKIPSKYKERRASKGNLSRIYSLPLIYNFNRNELKEISKIRLGGMNFDILFDFDRDFSMRFNWDCVSILEEKGWLNRNFATQFSEPFATPILNPLAAEKVTGLDAVIASGINLIDGMSVFEKNNDYLVVDRRGRFLVIEIGPRPQWRDFRKWYTDTLYSFICWHRMECFRLFVESISSKEFTTKWSEKHDCSYKNPSIPRCIFRVEVLQQSRPVGG